MRFGVNLFIWTANFDASHLPLLPGIKAAGFDGVEIPMYRGREFAVADVRRGLADTGLECTICSILVDGLSMISDDAQVRAKAVEQVKENIAATAECGGKVIAGPLYSPVGYLAGRRRTAEEWKRAVDCWQQLGPALTQHGVTAAIEPLNRFETFFLNTAADAARFCDEVNHPNVGVLFDTFHANIEEKDIAEGYRTVGRHLKHVHTCENDRGTPGSGHVEWRPVFEAIRDVGYDGWMTIESFGSNLPEIAAAAAIWRDLAATPGDVAFDGVKFIRQLWADVR
ncbi:MAG TPA: sugar phosphate isomerase/epimerase family protein [Bryobacteraceae bacterium]